MLRPACLVVLGVVLLAAAAPAARADCGGVHRAEPRASEAPGHRRALLIGDSTSILAVQPLAAQGVAADAKGCRGFGEGVRIVRSRRRAGTLPHLVILALGANGGVRGAAVEQALAAAGPGRVLGLVTPRNRRDAGRAMRAVARRHPDRVLVVDWRTASDGHRAWFAGDGLHVSTAGARAFARLIAERAAAVTRPPVARLGLPREIPAGAGCGTIGRGRDTLTVRVLRGRAGCAVARSLARRPPLTVRGRWRWFDWAAVPRSPWRDVYVRRGGRAVVATARVRPSPSARPGG